MLLLSSPAGAVVDHQQRTVAIVVTIIFVVFIFIVDVVVIVVKVAVNLFHAYKY